MKIEKWISDWNNKGARLTAVVMLVVILLIIGTVILVAPQFASDVKDLIKEVHR